MGDFGTIFPIVLGVALVSDVNLSHIFLFFALWYIISGLYYRLPVPIEPMKAIGAVVIAEGLTSGEIAASGMIVGAFFLILGILKGMSRIRNYIPESVIRGVQAGLALLLLRTSFTFITDDLLFATISVAIVLVFFIAAPRLGIPDISALVVVAVGIGAGLLMHGMPALIPFSLPSLSLPDPALLVPVTWHLAIPQIPLTLTNAILATSLLTADLFRKEVEPDRLSKTIGVMNLVSVPFGAFPMCHGAGGMAAMYRFGARTGGAAIIAGGILLIFAFFFATPEMLEIIPVGIFGGLLIFVAITLAKHSAKTDSYLVTILIAVLTLFIGITVAFIAGMALAWAEKLWKQKNGSEV